MFGRLKVCIISFMMLLLLNWQYSCTIYSLQGIKQRLGKRISTP